jgi:hypothetical protein
MAKIFQHNRRHCHAQGCRKVLHCHRLLLSRIRQKTNQAVCQVLSIAGLIKLHRQLFAIRHLPEIRKIGAHDRHSIGTGKMRDTTAPGRRGIRHHGDRSTLKQNGQMVLMHVTGELDGMIPDTLPLH